MLDLAFLVFGIRLQCLGVLVRAESWKDHNTVVRFVYQMPMHTVSVDTLVLWGLYWLRA